MRRFAASLLGLAVALSTAAAQQPWTTCPIEKILVNDGRACGIRLSTDAVFPGEEIRARVVVSNLTLAPTFLGLVGADVIGAERARQIKGFNYDDPQLLGVHYALKDDPVFASAAYDPEVQRSWVGYLGGESLDEIRGGLTQVFSGVLPDRIMGGWFIPTRADPSQAPAGCHTAFVCISVPPCPRSWRGRRLEGWDAWRALAGRLADAVTERMEEYAPGFKDLILERHVNSPLDQENSNPSAVRGNMIGGSAVPEQYGRNRPLPGIIVRGAARSFLPGLYLSNSIHPYGATHLATELFSSMAKIKMVAIQYKSTGAAMADLLSGQVPVIVGSLLPVTPHLSTGKLRARTSSQRTTRTMNRADSQIFSSTSSAFRS